MVRMHWSNKSLLFPEYRRRSAVYLIYKMIRYCMFFQVLFYTVMGNYFYLGSMDHLTSRSGIVSATNKDSIHIGRCTALFDVIRFNAGSWCVAIYILLLSYASWMKSCDWDYTAIPDPRKEENLEAILFAGPAALMAIMAFIVPIILNPFVLGWPFNPPLCRRKVVKKREKLPARTHKTLTSTPGGKVVDLHTFMTSTDAATKLEKEAGRVLNRPDVELGSLATNDFGFGKGYPISVAHPERSPRPERRGKKPSPSDQPTLLKKRSDPSKKGNGSQRSNSRTAVKASEEQKNRIKLAMI